MCAKTITTQSRRRESRNYLCHWKNLPRTSIRGGNL